MKVAALALTAWLCVMLCASCSIAQKESVRSNYLASMIDVRNSVHKNEISREKIFYYFQLDGAKSSRRAPGGVRSGYKVAREEWDLRYGMKLVAWKHYHVGLVQLTPLEKGESFFAEGPHLRLKEEYYHEPRLEPTFDELYLIDANGKTIASIELRYVHAAAK